MFAAFSDDTKTRITSVFSCPQDESQQPNQAEVDLSDPRYVTFYNLFPPAMQAFMDAPVIQG